MPFGPVQLLVLGFEKPEPKGEIMAKLEELRDSDIVRLIDLVVVRKLPDGTVERLQHSDLSGDEAEEFGAVVGALIGLGMDGEEGAMEGAIAGASAMEGGHVLGDDTWAVADVIPEDTAVAVALLEHRWALGLRDAIFRQGGFHIADAWIHPSDLVAVGLAAAEEE
jgi:uncharacterized membrane protein